MSRCTSPLTAYRTGERTAKGKAVLSFERKKAAFGLLSSQTLRCGQCMGCRLERSRQWAMRMMHEAQLYDDNCFLTLTYTDNNLPPGGSLDKTAFPLFMKRLRKDIEPQKVRFFHAGEYGHKFGRPHYHACLFGYDFADKIRSGQRADFPIWRSQRLEALWPLGRTEIGTVTFESAAYVARYICGKITGKKAEQHYKGRTPEYTTMSRRPGIGAAWLEQYMNEVYRSDSVIMRGKEMKPPRFYDSAFEIIDPTWHELVCSRRKRERQRQDETPERLDAQREVNAAKVNLYQRDIK